MLKSVKKRKLKQILIKHKLILWSMNNKSEVNVRWNLPGVHAHLAIIPYTKHNGHIAFMIWEKKIYRRLKTSNEPWKRGEVQMKPLSWTCTPYIWYEWLIEIQTWPSNFNLDRWSMEIYWYQLNPTWWTDDFSHVS